MHECQKRSVLIAIKIDRTQMLRLGRAENVRDIIDERRKRDGPFVNRHNELLQRKIQN